MLKGFFLRFRAMKKNKQKTADNKQHSCGFKYFHRRSSLFQRACFLRKSTTKLLRPWHLCALMLGIKKHPPLCKSPNLQEGLLRIRKKQISVLPYSAARTFLFFWCFIREKHRSFWTAFNNAYTDTPPLSLSWEEASIEIAFSNTCRNCFLCRCHFSAKRVHETNTT